MIAYDPRLSFQRDRRGDLIADFETINEYEVVKQQDSLPNIAKLSNILKYERN